MNTASSDRPLCLGSRRELMVDGFLMAGLSGAIGLRLHSPVPREVALATDRPWEGNMCGYMTVLREPVAGRFRMYYHSGDYRHMIDPHIDPATDISIFGICLAESDDGIHWERPPFRTIVSGDGAATNIVFRAASTEAVGWHGFSPFYDDNPAASGDEHYKAIGTDNRWPCSGLYLMTSCDGIRWRLKSDKPFLPNPPGSSHKFDSQNIAFWDPAIGRYRLYFREYDDRENRAIRLTTSADFVNWSEAEWLDYGPGTPAVQLYTNNVQPYYRAPHLFVGFPARYVERPWSPTIEALPELEHRRMRARGGHTRRGAAVTDALFMSSRDGKAFKRWDEAFFRPGLHETGNWAYGDNYAALGMIETESGQPGGGKELSFYTVENYWRAGRFRRQTLRVDGFVSLNAAYAGGEMHTKCLTFGGSRLSLNVATSAAGGLRVEIQDVTGKPIPGYTIDDCWEVVGDTLNYTVVWKSGRSVEKLAGRPVRLRIQMRDADLYSLQFPD